jgi:flagellar biogenesis protein FliO
MLYLFMANSMGLALNAAEAPKTEIAAQAEKEESLPLQFIEELKLAEEKGDSRFFQEFLNMLFYLGIIVLFIFIFMWVLKRLMNVRVEQINQTSAIKILERRSLTPKTTVYVLEVLGKAIAIADSVDGVTFLSEADVTQAVLPAKEKERE